MPDNLNFGSVVKPKLECPRHGVQWGGLQLIYFNQEGDQVFNRSYCIVCYDAFVQRYLEPMKEIKEEDRKDA